jgi:hypothetical protein
MIVRVVFEMDGLLSHLLHEIIARREKLAEIIILDVLVYVPRKVVDCSWIVDSLS